MSQQTLDLSSRRGIDAALAAKQISVAGYFEALDRIKWDEGFFVPACGGLEVPFTYQGRRYLYCFHTAAKVHRYIDLGTDMPMPAEWTPGTC